MQKSSFFCLKNSQSKETEDFEMKKEFYLYVSGQKVKVSEEIYKEGTGEGELVPQGCREAGKRIP